MSHPYSQAVINSIASLKRRAIPTSIAHPSVGTDEDIAARAEARNKLDALRLTRSILTHLLMSTDTMQQWGYVTQIPEGDPGSKPHAIGQITKCERCAQRYMVTSTPTHNECTYHWGRPFSKTINGASETSMPSSFPPNLARKVKNCAYTRAVQKLQARTVVQEVFTSFMNQTQRIFTSVTHSRSHGPPDPAMEVPTLLTPPLMSLL